MATPTNNHSEPNPLPKTNITPKLIMITTIQKAIFQNSSVLGLLVVRGITGRKIILTLYDSTTI